MENIWSRFFAIVAVAGVSLNGCKALESASDRFGVGGTTAAGTGAGALGGGGIGWLAGGKKGALIGALAGGVGGGVAGYFYAHNVQQKKATADQKKEAEDRYRDQLAQTPEAERTQLKSVSTSNKKAVAVKLADGTYQQVDPATGKAGDTSYVLPKDEEKKIQTAQQNGQVTKVDDYDVVFN